MLPAIGDEGCLKRLTGFFTWDELNNCLYCLTKLRIGYAENRHVEHGGMIDQYVLDLLRVNIDTPDMIMNDFRSLR